MTALTPNQRRVAILVADGLSAKQIARRMKLSYHTVHKHLGRIAEKIGTRHRVLIARYAIRQGWVNP